MANSDTSNRPLKRKLLDRLVEVSIDEDWTMEQRQLCENYIELLVAKGKDARPPKNLEGDKHRFMRAEYVAALA